MAIVNHTGDIAANETWAATDEHHITGNVTWDGGSSGNPIVVTVEAGVTIYFDGDFFVFYSPAVTDFGSTVAVGTEADKIYLIADPTTYPYATADTYYGFFVGHNTILDLDWVEVRNAQAFVNFWNTQNDADSGVAINSCSCKDCTDVFAFQGATSQDLAINNMLVVDGLFVEHQETAFWNTSFIAKDFNGTNPLSNIAIFLGGSSSLVPLILPKTDSKIALDFNNLLIGEIPYSFLPRIDMAVGESFDMTITGLFMEGVDGVNRYKITFPDVAYRGTVTIEESVLANAVARAFNLEDDDQATNIVVIQYCDILECGGIGLIYDTTTLGSLTIDNLHLAYNAMIEVVGDGILPQPPHYQWWDTNNNQAPTNVQATPIFPLDVENVVEGVPDTDSITITFDAAAGAGTVSKRLLGIPFILYGTTSGGPYTSLAGIVPCDKEERYKAFAKWTSKYGTFETLNHSVTLSNLKSLTTYYYAPCFIDPLGRIAEGTEGSFVTATAGGGVAGITDVGEGGIG